VVGESVGDDLGPMRERGEFLYVGDATRRSVRGKEPGTSSTSHTPNKQLAQPWSKPLEKLSTLRACSLSRTGAIRGRIGDARVAIIIGGCGLNGDAWPAYLAKPVNYTKLPHFGHSLRDSTTFLIFC
jgi:hypothetical protein